MPRRFQDDAEFLAYLQRVNPSCAYAPADFDWKAANERALQLVALFKHEFSWNVGFDGGMNIQDATFFADIGLPFGLLRFSNHDRLVTLCSDTPTDPNILAKIVSLLEQAGYTFVPFRFFGSSFSTLDRSSGGLFTQLFDYV
jgi:hypothetical protein